MTPEATRKRHIQLIQAGRYARAERLDPESLARFQHRNSFITGTLAKEPSGWVDDCYHARFSKRELRNPQYRIVTPVGVDNPKTGPFTHYRNIDGQEVELVYEPSPAKFPSLGIEDSDEAVEYLDTDDPLTLQAHRRYTKILWRVAQIKRKRGPKMADEIERLRGEWKEVREETGIAYDDPDGWNDDVKSVIALTGREGQMRIARDSAEVRYCHRDASPWQLDHELPEVVREQLAHKRRIAEMLDVDYTYEDAQRDREELLIRYRRKQIAVAWNRLFAELGPDAAHGRIVTKWLRKDGRYIRPLRTESRNQFIARQIAKAGSELEGLQLALDSLRFRLEKKRERNERRAA